MIESPPGEGSKTPIMFFLEVREPRIFHNEGMARHSHIQRGFLCFTLSHDVLGVGAPIKIQVGERRQTLQRETDRKFIPRCPENLKLGRTLTRRSITTASSPVQGELRGKLSD